MRRAILRGVAFVVMAAVAGCETTGWMREPITLQNDSDQTVILRRSVGNPPTPYPLITARPHETRTLPDVVGKGDCLVSFDIVDSAGKQLRDVGKVCANGTVVYP